MLGESWARLAILVFVLCYENRVKHWPYKPQDSTNEYQMLCIFGINIWTSTYVCLHLLLTLLIRSLDWLIGGGRELGGQGGQGGGMSKGGGRREGGKRDSQGGGNREK